MADILTKTCFVYGNENIFKQLVNGAQKLQYQKSQTDIIKEVHQQVKNQLNSYSTRLRLTDIKSQNTINIKRLVYQSTTIFIASLARLHNILDNSCFDIIDEMTQVKRITEYTAHKLQCAIAIACEIRLRVYMENQCQCNNAINLKQNRIDKFLNVGTASTIIFKSLVACNVR